MLSAVLAVLLFVTGCPKPATAPGQGAPPAPVVAAAPIPPAAPAPPPATPPEKPAPAKEELGNDYTANKKNTALTENEKKLEEELRSLRPKKVEKLVGTEIDVKFTAAAVPAKEGAQLCDLTFELAADGGRRATVTLTDKQRDAAATLDLGWCRVKVKPQLSAGDIVPIGSGKVMNRIQRVGHYNIAVLDAQGKLIANAALNRDRTLTAGAPVQGYTSWMRRDRERDDLGLLTVAKVNADKSTTELALLRWSDSGIELQSATDKVGNIFEYAFPAGELEVIPPKNK
jgi:hypothetical protein